MNKKFFTFCLAALLGMTFSLISCQKIEEIYKEKKEEAQELTDKAKSGALDVIDKGKEGVEKGADSLK